MEAESTVKVLCISFCAGLAANSPACSWIKN